VRTRAQAAGRRASCAVLCAVVVGALGPGTGILGETGAFAGQRASLSSKATTHTPAPDSHRVRVPHRYRFTVVTTTYLNPGRPNTAPYRVVMKVERASAVLWRIVVVTTLKRGMPPTTEQLVRNGDKLATTVRGSTRVTTAAPDSFSNAHGDELFRLLGVFTARWATPRCTPTLAYASGPVIEGIRSEILRRAAVKCNPSMAAPALNGPTTLWFDPRTSLVLRARLYAGKVLVETDNVSGLSYSPRFSPGDFALPKRVAYRAARTPDAA